MISDLPEGQTQYDQPPHGGQLLPCPFCGNTETPHVISYFECDYVDQRDCIDGFIVICDASGFDRKKGCGAATGWHETAEQAEEAWNRRKS